MKRSKITEADWQVSKRCLYLPLMCWEVLQNAANYNGRSLNDEICFQLFHHTPSFEKYFPRIREAVSAYWQAKTSADGFATATDATAASQKIETSDRSTQ